MSAPPLLSAQLQSSGLRWGSLRGLPTTVLAARDHPSTRGSLPASMASPGQLPASCSWCLLAQSRWKEQRFGQRRAWGSWRRGSGSPGTEPRASPMTRLPDLHLDPRVGAVDWLGLRRGWWANAHFPWLCWSHLRPVSPGTLCWNSA